MKPLVVDVRPLVSQRRPPLPAITHALSDLKPGQTLQVIAPFEPLPLYEFMRERGYSHRTEHLSDGSWVILFEENHP